MAERNDLEVMFATARQARPVASGDFLARVLTDAYALQPQVPVAAPRPAGLFARLRAALAGLGGVAVASGLATAALAGLWIGWAEPQVVTDLAGLWTEAPADSLELLPGLDAWLMEG